MGQLALSFPKMTVWQYALSAILQINRDNTPSFIAQVENRPNFRENLIRKPILLYP